MGSSNCVYLIFLEWSWKFYIQLRIVRCQRSCLVIVDEINHRWKCQWFWKPVKAISVQNTNQLVQPSFPKVKEKLANNLLLLLLSSSSLSISLLLLHNEIPKRSQCFNDHKLTKLSQRLSQVNVAGIYLSRELGMIMSRAKTSGPA